MTQLASPLLTLADLFTEMAQVLSVTGEMADGPGRLRNCWERHVTGQASLKALTERTCRNCLKRSWPSPIAIRAPVPGLWVTGDFFLPL